MFLQLPLEQKNSSSFSFLCEGTRQTLGVRNFAAPARVSRRFRVRRIRRLDAPYSDKSQIQRFCRLHRRRVSFGCNRHHLLGQGCGGASHSPRPRQHQPRVVAPGLSKLYQLAFHCSAGRRELKNDGLSPEFFPSSLSRVASSNSWRPTRLLPRSNLAHPSRTAALYRTA